MSKGRPRHVDQLNGTSLKWGRDGELSPLDHQRILQLLCQSDPVAESLIESVEQQGSPQTRSMDNADLAGIR